VFMNSKKSNPMMEGDFLRFGSFRFGP